MRTGSVNLSGRQAEMLSAAKSSPERRDLIELLYRIATDEDIRSGREEVHPDWVEIFQNSKDLVRSQVSARTFGRLCDFFNALLPYDPTVQNLDPLKQCVSFLLGAGASKPEPSNIPTVKDLLPHLLERARRLDRDDVTRLADFCDSRNIDNIEDLLTAAQLATFCSRNSTILELLNYLLYRRDPESGSEELGIDEIRRVRGRSRYTSPALADLSSVAFLQDSLQVLFGLLASTMLPAKPNYAHTAIADYSKLHSESSSIITTNYDCCMDMALEAISHPLLYCVEFNNRASQVTNGKNATRLLKLHGSLNWYYCETCQEVQLIDYSTMVKQYMDDRLPYPVIGICRDCGGQRRGLLVPPLAMKFDLAPPLTPLLVNANENFEKADLICVVGFSFAEADIYISRMLSKSMQTRQDQQMLIIDPDPKISDKVKRKFKASIPNFDTARILRIVGDCADMLPRFLRGEFRRKDEKEVT